MRFNIGTVAVILIASCQAQEIHENTFGTLQSCERDEGRCLWVGEGGKLVDSSVLRDQMLQQEGLDAEVGEEFQRNLEVHMQYIEGM
jgi:hypothetical protein